MQTSFPAPASLRREPHEAIPLARVRLRPVPLSPTVELERRVPKVVGFMRVRGCNTIATLGGVGRNPRCDGLQPNPKLYAYCMPGLSQAGIEARAARYHMHSVPYVRRGALHAYSAARVVAEAVDHAD